MRIFQGEQEYQRDQRTYAFDLLEQRDRGIALPRQRFHAIVALAEGSGTGFLQSLRKLSLR